MVSSCSAVGCTNRCNKGSNLGFYRFPFKNKKLLKEWLHLMRRDKWVPTRTSVICSDHFAVSCYSLTAQKQKKLITGAVPTIFSFNKSEQAKRKQPLMRTSLPIEIELTVDVTSKVITSVKAKHNDHTYATMDSPKKLKRRLDEAEVQISSLNKKLYSCQRQLQARLSEIETLKDVLDYLADQNLISKDDCNAMNNILPNGCISLFKNAVKNAERSNGRSYDDDIKLFSMSLYFLSPKAYELVREKLFLPHFSTILYWCRSLDGRPGFTEEIFQTLKILTDSTTKKKKCCSLILDEMSIRKQVIYDGKEYVGFVDLGIENAKNNDIATQALVFMIVSLEDGWKIPIAYFLIESLSGEQKAALIKVALSKLYAVGIHILAIVCDGLSSNVKMFRCLGASISVDHVANFSHPSNPKIMVVAIFDVCHLLKLLRNLLAETKVLLQDGKQIEWTYIDLLHKVQEDESLTAATKVKRDHIEWWRQKMKVKLAAQTFSKSVANALLFMKKINFCGFENCITTADFFFLIDKLFDILNSRNPFGVEGKAPLRKSNMSQWKTHLHTAKSSLIGLSNVQGKKILNTQRNMCVLGFCITINSVLFLADTLLNEPYNQEYILTYKLSQDHLELFFAAIRSKGGKNNNPNVVQLRSAYRQLVLNRLITSSHTANCISFGDIEMLCVKVERNGVPTDVVQISNERCSKVFGQNSAEYDKDIFELNPIISNLKNLSLYAENVVVHIAGFVARKMFRTISCPDCQFALIDISDEMLNDASFYLLNFKDRGGLYRPSRSVCVIARLTEQTLRAYPTVNGIVSVKNPLKRVQCDVLMHLQDMSIFTDLNDHVGECELNINVDNHITLLKKLIIRNYAIIKMHYFAKKATHFIKGINVRSKLSKIILFKNQ